MSNPGPVPQIDILSGTAAFITAEGDFLQQKFDAKGKVTVDSQQNAKAGAPYGNKLDDFMLAVVDAIALGAMGGTLAQVLANGNVSGGTNLVISAGDLISTPAALIAGAAVTDGPVGARDLVIGDGLAAYGLSIFTSGAAIGQINFTDSIGGNQGGLQYDHSNNQIHMRASGATQYRADTTSFRPGSDGLNALGSDTSRFSDTYSDIVYVAGASLADAIAVAGDLVIGDGATTVDYGITIHTNSDAEGNYAFSDGAGVDNGGMRYTHAGDVLTLRAGTTAVANFHSTYVRPAVNGTFELGTAGRRWEAGYIDTGYFGGAASGDAAADANDLIIGDGVGGRGLTVFTGAGSSAYVVMTDVSGTFRSGLRTTFTNDDMLIYTGGSVRLRMVNATSSLRPEVTGSTHLGEDLVRFGNAYLDVGYFGGASSGDAISLANDLVIGDGTAADRGISIFTGNANAGRLVFNDSIGGAQGFVGYEHNNTELTFGVESSARVRLDSTKMYSDTSGYDLGGTGTDAFDKGYIDNVISLDGVRVGDTVADGATLFGGTGAPAAGLGINGDFYFRDDGGLATHIYFKAGGAWAGLV